MSMYNFGGGSSFADAFRNFNPTKGLWNQWSPVQQEYYFQNPQAVVGLWNGALSGMGAPGKWREFADKWMQDQYGNYQGYVGNYPETSFADYLSQQAPKMYDDYKYSLSTRPLARPTRFLRR